MVLSLYVFKKKTTEPSTSPFCQKLETYLRANNYTSYEVKHTLPNTSPKGQLPYVVLPDGANKVSDSHFIIKELIAKGITRDLDTNLTPAQRADSRAWIGYVENMTFATVYTRFIMPSGWKLWKVEIFGDIPWPLRPIIAWYIRRQVGKALLSQGIGRHSEEEIKGFLREYLVNLDARLGANPESRYLFGNTVSMADIVVYSFLACILATSANPFQTALILERPTLRAYVARCTKEWFPEYKRVLALVE